MDTELILFIFYSYEICMRHKEGVINDVIKSNELFAKIWRKNCGFCMCVCVMTSLKQEMLNHLNAWKEITLVLVLSYIRATMLCVSLLRFFFLYFYSISLIWLQNKLIYDTHIFHFPVFFFLSFMDRSLWVNALCAQ